MTMVVVAAEVEEVVVGEHGGPRPPGAPVAPAAAGGNGC
jgi:hypothetical protein